MNMTTKAHDMKFTLLTHEREMEKRSNTGRVVLEVLGAAAEQICWSRANPPAGLLEEIAAGGVALIYPGPADAVNDDLTGISRVILIDSTWQESRKIHQRSPYLHTLRRICLNTTEKSVYNLRKNQKESGLCTAECVIEILRATGETVRAEQLHERFLAYIRPQGAVRGEVPGH